MKSIRLVLCLFMCCLFLGSNVYAGESEAPDIVDVSNHTYTYAEMECDLAELAKKYPDYISCTSVGVSHDFRNVWQIVIGNPNATKAIHIQAGIHGREWMNCWMLLKQTEELLKNWNTPVAEGVTLGTIFDRCAVYILPMVNPDGVTISQSGIEGIVNEALRRNLYQMSGASKPAKWKANAAGVDLNRNFSVGWGNTVNVHAPASQCYNGAAPFTEPEVLAVAASFKQRRFDIAISYHSMEGAIYWNVGQQGDLLAKTAELAGIVSQLTGYSLGKPSKIHGLDYNWTIMDQNTPTALIETGTVSCPLPYSQWNEVWNRNKDLIKNLAIIYATK